MSWIRQQSQLTCGCVRDVLQAQQRRILQLEGEVEALRVEAGRQQESLTHQRVQTQAAESRVQELQQELDNNAGRHLCCSYECGNDVRKAASCDGTSSG